MKTKLIRSTEIFSTTEFVENLGTLKLWLLVPRVQKALLSILFVGALLLLAQQSAQILWQIVFYQPSVKVTTLKPEKNLRAQSIHTKKINFSPLADNTWFGLSPKYLENQISVEDISVETTLNLSLKGTMLGQTSQAIIKDNQTGKSLVVKEKGEILPGIILEKVDRRKIVLNNHGKLEKLSLPGSAFWGGTTHTKSLIKQKYIPYHKRPVAKRQRVAIARSMATQALSNLGMLSQEGKLIPMVTGKDKEGYMVYSMKHNGLLTKLSLKEGDILLKLNGVRVTEKEKLFPLLMGLKEQNSAELVVHRAGENIALLVETVE